MDDFIGLLIRISLMYITVLGLLRLSGKRSIGDISPIDFAVSTIVGDMFDDFMWSEVPLSQFLVGVSTIIFLATVVDLVQYRSQWLHHLLTGKKVVVIQNGNLVREGMHKERSHEDTIIFSLREQEIDRIQEVREAAWEPSGQMSVLKEKWAEPVKKKEVDQLKRAVK